MGEAFCKDPWLLVAWPAGPVSDHDPVPTVKSIQPVTGHHASLGWIHRGFKAGVETEAVCSLGLHSVPALPALCLVSYSFYFSEFQFPCL